MRHVTWWRRARAACAAVMLLVSFGATSFGTARPAFADPFEIGDSEWEGGAELYKIAKTELGPDRVKVSTTLDWSLVRPDDGVLLIHPTESIDLAEASEFMKLGGRLAVLDDYGKGEEILRRFKIERTAMPDRPVLTLRKNRHLPIAEPYLDPGRANAAPHPVVANVDKLVLNHPAALIHPDLSPVLRVRVVGAEDAIVAVAGQVGKGRLFAMSDPSAVINSMLRYPGNRAFAAGLVRYLVNEPDRKNGRLFILVNQFKDEGSVNGESSLAKDLEGALSSIADGISEARRDGFPPWLFTLLAVGTVGLLGMWVFRASARTYKSPTPRYARPVPLVSRGGVAGRFALLAAPTSPKSLVLLELKSAAMESLVERFSLEHDPSTQSVLRAMRASGLVNASLQASFERIVATMQRAEAAVLAGNEARIRSDTLPEAAKVIEEVLRACEAAPVGAARRDDRAPADPAGAEQPA